MFTAEQIKAAHAKVKTGADYPQYIQALKQMGVQQYDFMVANGDTVFYGHSSDRVTTHAPLQALAVAAAGDAQQLAAALRVHQQGLTDFPTFRQQAADAGVCKWTADLQRMVVLYVDKAGNLLLEEPVPQG